MFLARGHLFIIRLNNCQMFSNDYKNNFGIRKLLIIYKISNLKYLFFVRIKFLSISWSDCDKKISDCLDVTMA